MGGPEDDRSADALVERAPDSKTALFYEAAKRHSAKGVEPERVRVYEKLRAGIWVFDGVFRLRDAWREQSDGRQVFKFRLELDPEATPTVDDPREPELDQTRLIPTAVKPALWKRHLGRCVECGSQENLRHRAPKERHVRRENEHEAERE